MPEVEVNVTVGGVKPLTVPLTSTATTPISGGGWLAGWSIRDGVADSSSAVENAVVAPGAGATIATITGIAAGTYTVEWNVALQGAAAAADANNFQLLNGVTVIAGSVNPGAAGEYPQANVVAIIPAGGSVTVKAVGAGTAGVTYSAQIALIPNGLIETVVEITSGQDVLGEITVRDLDSLTQWFGPDGPCFVDGITLTAVSGAFRGCIYYVPNYP